MAGFFSVGTYNVRGLRNDLKRRTVFDFLGTQRHLMCFLQEVHLKDRGDVVRFSREWVWGESVWSVGGVYSSGVGILFGYREVRVEETFVVVQGRVVGADISFRGLKLRVFGVYGPQGVVERGDMFEGMIPHLMTNRTVIVGGDFNCELGGGGDTSVKKLETLMKVYKLVDGGRAVTPRMDGPTWRNSQGVSRRLDYILFSESLGLLSGRVAPTFFSDHDGVALCVRAGESVFGPGYWRLNSSVLEQDEFAASFVVFFRGLVGIRSLYPGVMEWWEVVKERIREFTVRYCRRKAREARREVLRLQRLLELEYAIGNDGGTVDQRACDSLKAELREVYERRARGYLMRTRHDFLEKDETCSAAFFSSVRAAKVKHVLTGIRDEQGRVVTGVEEMVQVATRHYRSFFVEREVDVGGGEVMLDFLTRRVPTDIAEAMEAPLTLEELESALRRMGRRKVPGIDGLPAEFYLKFWGTLGPVVLEVLSEVLRTGVLGGSLAKGVISLLFKKGDSSDLRNWRPLTMLCVDYKLLAKVLADRLGTALPYVVHEDQTCGVAGRSLRWNLLLIRDAIAWAEDRHLPLMVVGLDQAKAFDRVHLGFLFRVLDRLGFGRMFVGWLRTLYAAAGSTVSVNGHLGEFFRLHSGVRQGCPLSPLLYVLYMEPLAEAIRADAGVSGFLVPGSGGLRVKLSQYADDTTLLLESDPCLIRSLEIFQEFGRASGADLNLAKSSVKFFGRWKGRTDVPGGLSLCEGPLRILGVDFETAQNAMSNWTRRMAKVQQKLGLWKTRTLTLIGKVLVLKVDILPSLLYLAYVYPLPVSMRRPLVRLIFNFLWRGGYEYVARSRMMAGIGEGGRDVPHLPLKLDCFFVSFLLRELATPVVHPSGYFLRLFFTNPARRLMVWNNLTPRVEQLPPHFEYAARWLRAHPVALDPAVGLEQRVLWSEVRSEVEDPPVVGIPAAVWLGVQPRGLDNRLKDFNWMVIHRSLPVRDKLYRHGIARSPECPRVACAAAETVRHVMWDCPFAGVVWQKAGRILRNINAGFVLTWEKVERGLVGVVRSRKSRFLLWLTISLLKRGMWLARQDLVQHNRDWGAEGVVRRVVGDLVGRMKWDMEKLGNDAAMEKWKGGLGLM